MADPVIVPCAADAWTLVATAVLSANVYPRGVAPGPPPSMFRYTYRDTGNAAPANDAGVVVGFGDRDRAAPSVRAEFATAMDLYIMAVGGAAECEVHSPVGDSTAMTQPVEIENDVAIVAAPVGGINVPSDDGIVMDGFSDIAFQIYLLGGQTNAHVNRTVTAIFQVSDDLLVGAVRQWVTTAAGYDQGTDATSASWSSVGLTALGAAIDFENLQHKRIRMNYTFDGAPQADHPGAVICVERRK